MPCCLWPQECQEARHEQGGLGGYNGRGRAGAGRESYSYTPTPPSVAWETSQQHYPSSAPYNPRPSTHGEGERRRRGGGGHTGYSQAQSRPHQQYWIQSLPQQHFAGEPSTKPTASRQQMLDLQNASYDGANRRTAFNASPLPYNEVSRSSISPRAQGAGYSRFKVTWRGRAGERKGEIRACLLDDVSSSDNSISGSNTRSTTRFFIYHIINSAVVADTETPKQSPYSQYGAAAAPSFVPHLSGAV